MCQQKIDSTIYREASLVGKDDYCFCQKMERWSERSNEGFAIRLQILICVRTRSRERACFLARAVFAIHTNTRTTFGNIQRNSISYQPHARFK